MISWILAVLLLIALFYAWHRLYVPFTRLREHLRQLAAGDLPTNGLYSKESPQLRASTEHLRAISDRLRTLSEQITDEELNLQAILSSMIEGVVIVDPSLKIRLANKELPKMFNLERTPLNRTTMATFRDHVLQRALTDVLTNGAPHTQELILDTYLEGRHAMKHLEVTAVALRQAEQGSIVGALVIFHDITRVKELENVRTEFVANVSHELRTPLSVITGYLESLMDGALDDRPTAERFIRVMHKHGERLNLLIEDLLTITRLESRSSTLDFAQGDLEACIDRALEQLEPQILSLNTRIIKHVPDGMLIELDSHWMEQVFRNLLDNALRYSGSDEVQIEAALDEEADGIVVTVKDNGLGIPAEDQPHIFERFYRVHKDRSRNAGGTGLGLSIVKHVVQAHGGTVHVRSSPGQGASFILRLPRTQQAP